MRGINNCCFGGNLTMDPEVRYTPSGAAVVNFSIAANRTWTDGNGVKQEETCFMKCTAWNKGGETIAQYIKKGDPLYVEGYLKTNQWDDKQTGAKRSGIELVVNNFTFLGSGDGNTQRQSTDAAPQQQRQQPNPPAAAAPDDDDDIPF